MHLEYSDFKEHDQEIVTVKDFIVYLQNKLGGVDYDDAKEMSELKAKDQRKIITLTTAHKSKGLEWDRVFLLRSGDYDPKGKKIRNEQQADQERNAWYVACTRARNTLMISSDDQP